MKQYNKLKLTKKIAVNKAKTNNSFSSKNTIKIKKKSSNNRESKDPLNNEIHIIFNIIKNLYIFI